MAAGRIRQYIQRAAWRGLLAGGLLAGASEAQVPPPGAGPAALVPPPATVPLTGPLALSVRLPGGTSLATRPSFPEIEGFRKAPTLVNTTTTRLLPGGQRRTELTLTQRYYPYAEGSYVVPAFDVVVNGQLLHSPATTVRVGAAPPAARSAGAPPATGSLDQLLGRPKPQYFYEPPDQAYLALEADPATVYVGQGAHVVLSLYLAPADQALLNFYDFPNQLAGLRQQLRQPTAWQAPAPDPAVLPDTVRRPGQPVLLRFRLADCTYYPLTPRALSFPALALTLTKFKLLKAPQPGENERLATYKTYRSQPLRVGVRPLPGGAAGPTAVGEYELRESLSEFRPRSGEAFTYSFGVEGSGNPAAVVPSRPAPPPGLAMYGPEIKEEVLGAGRWRKTFRYRLVARRPGPVPLPALLQLPFFNPATARYDTLRPTLRPVVRGGAPPPATQPTDDVFYGPALARADTRLQPLDVYSRVARYASWLLAGLLVVAATGAWRGRTE